MTRKELKKKIKDEYKSGLDFLDLDNRNCITLMFDKSDGDFWVNAFSSCNEWKVYHNPDIIQIPDEIPWYGNDQSFDARVERILEYCIKEANENIITE